MKRSVDTITTHVAFTKNLVNQHTSSKFLKISRVRREDAFKNTLKSCTQDLSVSSIKPRHDWWRLTGSNRRPPACKAGALPAELNPQLSEMVGLDGFEPSTPALSRRCSNQLSYRPSATKPEGQKHQPKRAFRSAMSLAKLNNR